MTHEADEDGFPALAERFRGVAAIEKALDERYRVLLKNVETRPCSICIAEPVRLHR